MPEGYILILQNKDVPGVVGAVGTILGNNGVNIAGMELGRSEKGGNAISFTHVDDAVAKRRSMSSVPCRKSFRQLWSNCKEKAEGMRREARVWIGLVLPIAYCLL